MSVVSAPQPSQPKEKHPIAKAISAFLLFIGLTLLKLKALALLLLTKFRLLLVNPFEGFGAVQYSVAAGSIVVTILAYATQFRFGLVVGFVLITLIHEIGHAVVIRAKGLRAG